MAERYGTTPALQRAIEAHQNLRAKQQADIRLQESQQRIAELARHLQTSIEAERTTIAREIRKAEQAAQFSQAMEMPDGKYYKLPLTPTWQLVISSENKEEGSSSRTSRSASSRRRR